jgi:hypothetical protein
VSIRTIGEGAGDGLMSVEARLRKLEICYRSALSGAVAAKAHYLAQADNRGATPAKIAHLQRQWKNLENQRKEIAERMAHLETLEQTEVH